MEEEDPPKDIEDGIVRARPLVARGVSLVNSDDDETDLIVSCDFVFAATARILRAPKLFNCSCVPVSVTDIFILLHFNEYLNFKDLLI